MCGRLGRGRVALLGFLPNPVAPHQPSTSAAAAFSSTSHASNAPRIRPSTEAVAEKVRKIERKRAERELSRLSDQARRAERRVESLERDIDLREKAIIAEVSDTAVRDGAYVACAD